MTRVPKYMCLKSYEKTNFIREKVMYKMFLLLIHFLMIKIISIKCVLAT